MSQPQKPTKTEAAAMLRNEQRNKEHLGFTLTCQALLAEAGGPLGIRDFAIRLRHRNTGDMYSVLSAFDGYKDDTLHEIRDAERRWWADGFGGLVLETLHAAVISGAAVVTGRIAGRYDKQVALDPVQLSSGTLDVDKGSLSVDEGGVVEVFTRLYVAGPTGSQAAEDVPVATTRTATLVAKQPPPPTAVRPRPRRDKVVAMAEALHAVLRQYPEHAVPKKVVGSQGNRKDAQSEYEGCHFLHMQITQREIWELLPPDTQKLFVSLDSFQREVAGPGGKAREGYLVSLADQDVLERLRAGFRKKGVGLQGKGVMHVGGGVTGDKGGKGDKKADRNGGKPRFPRLYWADLRDGRQED